MTIPRPKPMNVFVAKLNFIFFFHEYSPSYAIPSLTVHTYVTTMLFHSTFYFKSACFKQPPLCYILSQISFPQMSSGREVSAVPGKFPNSPAKHAFRELFRMSCIPEMHLCHVFAISMLLSSHRLTGWSDQIRMYFASEHSHVARRPYSSMVP